MEELTELDDISISSSDEDTMVSICMSDTVSEISDCNTFLLDNLSDDDIAEIITDIYEQIHHYVQENTLKISSPTFYSDICDEIADTLFMEWESAGICDEDSYDDIIELIHNIMDTYKQYNIMPQRTTLDAAHKLTTTEIKALSQQIDHLQSLVQPEQRTPEWYEFQMD